MTSPALRNDSEPPEPFDPFGSRPDEKPPSGWNDRFWDDVRLRIDKTRGQQDGELPDPGRWRRRGARLAGALVALLVVAGGAGLASAMLQRRAAGHPPAIFPPTLVNVVDSDRDVEVDWARIGGLDAGATVFRSIDPDVSYVYIDQSLPPLTAHAVSRDLAAASRGNRADVPVGLVRVYRGRLLPSTQEVEVTTFFRDREFLLIDEADASEQQDGGLEDEIVAHARRVYSLGEVTSLGGSRMALTGGAVVVDGGPHLTRLSIEGRPVGRDAAQLLVSQSNDGREIVATSVIARRGRTIILAGGGGASRGSDTREDEILLVAFTLL